VNVAHRPSTGYRFLSENAAFAENCEAAGIAFVGPTPQQMRDFAQAHGRALAQANDLLLSGICRTPHRYHWPAQHRLPGNAFKSTAGGGGIGFNNVIHRPARLIDARRGGQPSATGVFWRSTWPMRAIECRFSSDGKGTVIAGERLLHLAAQPEGDRERPFGLATRATHCIPRRFALAEP
jgi:urea carboxylase